MGARSGPTPSNERVEFDLVLSMPHEADLDAFVDRVNDPASPDYHHYATPEEIGQRFGLSDVALARVDAWLANAGLEVVESFPQRTALRVAGPARVVSRLFHVKLIDRIDPSSHLRYHEPRGDAVVPLPVADAVQAVAGLNTRPIVRPSPKTVPLGTDVHEVLAERRVLHPGQTRAPSTSPRSTIGGCRARANTSPSSWTGR